MSDIQEKLAFLLGLQERLGGSIPFEQWMQEALYHEKYGYYTANIKGIGRGGDFTTWPALQSSLAGAIADWLLQHRPARKFHLIEVGAGGGHLAESLLRIIGWWNRPHYHIVEISPVLRAAQRKRVGRSVIWHDSMAAAVAASGGEALIISNELVDAFPCRVFQKQEAGWRELALRIEDGRAVEAWRESPLPESSVFAHDWPIGQRVEVQPSFASWQKEWVSAWRAGRMLTIDYGDRSPDIYQRRRNGSLRAYAHQQRLEGSGVYNGFGRRDLTVDVNFTDLVHWGEQNGLKTFGLTSLAQFIGSRREDDPISQTLHAPGGAGQAFLVLDQGR